MDNTLENSKKRLIEAVDKLQNLLAHKSMDSHQIAAQNDPESISHIKELNHQLKKENAELKEQLFSIISNFNSLKQKNSVIHTELEDTIKTLENIID